MDLEEVHGEGGRISTKYRELPVIFFAWGRGVGYIGGTFLSKILYLMLFFSLIFYIQGQATVWNFGTSYFQL